MAVSEGRRQPRRRRGGSSVPAPFEPRHYQELWDAIGSAGFGTCGVLSLPSRPEPGFVFGFDYTLEPGGCIDDKPSITLTASEFATRAQRDAAGHGSAAPARLLLGRWALEITGTDDGAARLLQAQLESIDAQPLPS